MRTIKIGKIKVGEELPAFLIAEVGINHNSDLKLAKRLIESGAEVGANAVKFQIFKAEELCSRGSQYYDLFKSLEFAPEEWGELSDFAKDSNTVFTASVFGRESTELLHKLRSPMFKTASGDLTHLPLLRYIARKKKPILISTGMATIAEVTEAVNAITESGNDRIVILHCVSNYPSKFEETNLKAIQTLRDIFPYPIGFSDHSEGPLLPFAARAMGACIIEKHFTIDKNLPGPDQKLSLNPAEFRQMVDGIRSIETALGDGVKMPTKSEHELSLVARRSIVAKQRIEEGEEISMDMVSIVRPGTGLPPKLIDIVVGRRARREIEPDQVLTWDDI
jgi:N-acetylneuraminate synthase/N,N'-diacetyllegionaminate synthase